MKISTKLIFGTSALTSVVLLSFGIFSTVIMQNKVSALLNESIKFRAEQLTSSQTEMLSDIDDQRERLVTSYDDSMRSVMDAAVSVLKYYYGLEQDGKLSHADAQERAINTIRALEYNKGAGYFWMDSDKYILLAHNFFPEREGQNRYEVTDPTGFKLFQSIVRNAVKYGSVYTNYLWPKPGRDLDVWIPKRAYSAYFPEWGWIPSTGNYIEDIILR